MKPLLDIRCLTVVSRGRGEVISSLSLCLSPQECLGIVGPNGSGKTTLLRTLIGELPVYDGQILLHGKSIALSSRSERARSIALLAQHNDAAPGLRVEEYVALGCLPWSGMLSGQEVRGTVYEALEHTGLLALRARQLATLSGGERQRAALARAFAQRPQLLLLDEPTNHLDPLARSMLLMRVRAKNIAVIAVLHDLSLLSGFADRVAVLNAGKLVHQDVPQRFFTHPCMQEVFGVRCDFVTHPRHGTPVPIFEVITDNW
jgi:iron complex transport system ATP-binding protein